MQFLNILCFVVACAVLFGLLTAILAGHFRHQRKLRAIKAATDLRRELDARSVPTGGEHS